MVTSCDGVGTVASEKNQKLSVPAVARGNKQVHVHYYQLNDHSWPERHDKFIEHNYDESMNEYDVVWERSPARCKRHWLPAAFASHLLPGGIQRGAGGVWVGR